MKMIDKGSVGGKDSEREQQMYAFIAKPFNPVYPNYRLFQSISTGRVVPSWSAH